MPDCVFAYARLCPDCARIILGNNPGMLSDTENHTQRKHQVMTHSEHTQIKQFSKVLVANRGEIAIRAFRAAHELGSSTVAVYPWEDRHSSHRIKADEAYQIGEVGHPVKAYLNVEEIIEVAKSAGAEAIYPGYGFLSENPELARACEREGIAFVGPTADVLDMTGNKATAIHAAQSAGLPTLGDTKATADLDELERLADESGLPYPLFVKAVAGGGGRGMRLIPSRDQLRELCEIASNEAATAFGDPTVFLEQAVVNPKHIEVQILADGYGNVVHLFERDCSVQRRHQKVVELAPAPSLSPEARERICSDAVKFAKHINYRGAGTVEFLVDEAGNHVFIEMNPRVQVEHTVTEEITDVDIVSSQLQIAAGASLADLGLSQDTIRFHGAALQCRITTEDPSNGFRPDTGYITAYRSPGGSGVRLDGGTSTGAEVTGHFDSMLVKLTCRGTDFSAAIRRARRALDEFRIRGVATNIRFLRGLLDDPDFRAGNFTTSFIGEHEYLLHTDSSLDRSTKIMKYLADVTVNKPNGVRATTIKAVDKLPAVDLKAAPPKGSRDVLQELGPEGFAQWLKERPGVAVTDTSFRDAHQSLLATRVRTNDLVAAAGHVARVTPQLLSVEGWGGATYDVALRFLKEDPWARLDQMREALPNICIQMLLRGRNTVGYTPYPEAVTKAFVQEAARSGIDIFRIFDALNDVSQMQAAIDAVRETGTAVAEVAMSYAGNVADPNEKLYTLDYYLKLAERIVNAGAHVLAIKDMAGLLRPAAATKLVTALKKEFDLPIHIHTHDTAGGSLATYMAAWRAGADAIDGASAPLSGTTSQPSLSAIVAATADTEFDTGLSLDAVSSMEPYWEAVRSIYAPFDKGLSSPTGRVYKHEIPGGQLTNLRAQATALGLEHNFEQIEDAYAAADQMLGHLVKVTPSSKVVGDLALQLVGSGIDPAEFAQNPQDFDIPESVIGFLNGELGTPPGGWPEPFRSKALKGREKEPEITPVSPEDEALLHGTAQERRDTLNRLLFPGPTKEFEQHKADFGEVTRLSTNQFFFGLHPNEEEKIEMAKGVELLVQLQSISEPDARGVRTVMCFLNGELRPVFVRDNSVQADETPAEKADRSVPGQVPAPYAGNVTVAVAEGDTVSAGDKVAVIEAMKMEASITALVDGTVTRVISTGTFHVDGGDLILEIS